MCMWTVRHRICDVLEMHGFSFDKAAHADDDIHLSFKRQKSLQQK